MSAVDVTFTFQQKMDAVQAFVMHHLKDSSVAKLPFLDVVLPPYLTLHGVMVIMAAVFLLVLFGVFYRKNSAVPHGLTNALEVFVVYIRDEIAIRCFGSEDGRKLTPLLCTLFFFILALNLIGLIPCFSSATANVSVTGSFATVSLLLMTLGAMFKKGILNFFKELVPAGVPLWIVVILMPLEFAGLFIKSFALTIRLFVNMLAGHMVIYFLLGLIYATRYFAFPSIVMPVMVYIIEIGMAFLQAYVFVLLTAVFAGHVFAEQH